MKTSPIIALFVFLAIGSAHAEVHLLTAPELRWAMKDSAPCCVIDGRSKSQRTKAPLENAVPFRADLHINPTATVVVLADSDKEALRIAGLIEKQHPGKSIIAVKGGLAGWKAASTPDDAPSASDGSAQGIFQFVIPHNTCETGKPLQTLQSKPK